MNDIVTLGGSILVVIVGLTVLATIFSPKNSGRIRRDPPARRGASRGSSSGRSSGGSSGSSNSGWWDSSPSHSDHGGSFDSSHGDCGGGGGDCGGGGD